MPPFRFRLESVRRLRQARRDELRGHLADAHRAADVLAKQREQVAQELADVRRAQGSTAQQKILNVGLIRDSQRYALVLEAQVSALADKVKLVDQEIERRRQAVVEAEREVGALDKLETRQQAGHNLESDRIEAKQMDEVAVTGFRLRMADKGGNGV